MTTPMTHWRVVTIQDGAQVLSPVIQTRFDLELGLFLSRASHTRVLGVWRVVPKIRGEGGER